MGRIDPHLDTRLGIGVDFDIGPEFAAVDEMETVDRALVFRRRFIGQSHERLIGMARGPAFAVKRVDTADKRRAHDLTFPSPGTRQLDHIKISIRKIDGHAQSFVQMDIFGSVVAEAGRTRQHRIVPEQGVAQNDFHLREGVFQGKQQRFRRFFLCFVSLRQALQWLFARHYFMALVGQQADGRLIGIQTFECRFAEIAAAVARKLLRQGR